MTLEVNNSKLNLNNLRIELAKQVIWECGKFKLKLFLNKIIFALSFMFFKVIFYNNIADPTNTFCSSCGSSLDSNSPWVKCDKCLRWYHYPDCCSYKEEDPTFYCNLCNSSQFSSISCVLLQR